ncbi:MAG: zinc-binding dehydrogenase [Candidatus Bathyarchaeia archaeon]
MKAIMKAAPTFGIEIVNVDAPTPARDQILLGIEAAGICGSDIHIYEWGPFSCYDKVIFQNSRRGKILGHEASGAVAEVGADLRDSWQIGERVLLDPHVLCGECHYCMGGKAYLCTNRKTVGIHLDGAMARYLAVHPRQLLRLPNYLDYDEATIVEPFAVAYHALRKSGVNANDSIAVVGPGPIGLSAVLTARLLGIKKIAVIGKAVDIENGRLDLAKELGAEIIVDVSSENATEVIHDWTGSTGVHVCIDASGVRASEESSSIVYQTLDMITRGGKVVMIAAHPKTGVELDFLQLLHEEKTLQMSIGYTLSEISEVLQLVSDRKVRLDMLVDKKFPLEEGQAAFQIAGERKSSGRTILKPS